MLVLAGGVLAIGTPVGAGTALYGFVDERGVLHLTNVPSDRRYTRISALRSLATRSSADRVSPASIDRFSAISAYDDLIERASRRHRVPAALVKAVIHAES
ncbi:unnamed protein product, partial [marine sediment metagenome]